MTTQDSEALRVRRVHRLRWMAIGLAAAIVAASATFYASVVFTRDGNQRATQLAEATAAQISSTLGLAIQHEGDLVVNGAGFFVTNPTADQAQFAQWVSAVQAFQRYPELEAISEVTMVTPAQLGALSLRQAGGTGTDPVGTPLRITPAGVRPYYCVATVWQDRLASTATPPGLDFCATSYRSTFLRIRDSGRGAILPYGTGRDAVLGAAFPIYRGGAAPSTVAGRRAAFIGWVAEELNPRVALTAALRGHAHTAVTLTYKSGQSVTSFSDGSAPSGALTVTNVLPAGWLTSTRLAVALTNPFNTAAGLFRLGIGALFSLLLGILIYVLGTSRSRALQLVDESTVALRHQALHDPLTGLPNRSLILDRITLMQARSRREGTDIAVLFLDLDNFKAVNDTFGHAAGDELLTAVGQRLRRVLRDGDTVGRLGGDEFVVLVEGASLVAGADAVADRLLDVLSGPFELQDVDEPMWVTVSIGIAEGDRATPEEMLQDADIALYQAKATGKQHAVMFSPSMQIELEEQRSLELDLRGALDAGQFFIRYQPATDLATRSTTGMEARLGWRHPTRGEVPGDVFIPALVATGLLPAVGRWLVRTACHHAAAWPAQGRTLAVSVTASPAHFGQDEFVADVQAALADSGLEPRRLVITVPETALGEGGAVTIARIEELKATGVRVALGRFESGYSSLTYLHRYPFDILKIDRALMVDQYGPSDPFDLARTLIQLGQVFEVEIVVEDSGSTEGELSPFASEPGLSPAGSR